MNEKYRHWFIPMDQKFTIEDIINRGGYYDIDGVWNSILKIDGELLRGRVEVLILDEDKIYLQMKDDGTYRIPGGSFEKGVFNKDQAAAEAREEARINCKNVSYSGVNYIRFFDKKYKQEPGKVYWSGTYNEVYVAEYDGQYHGKINDIDKDDNMFLEGKFYPLSMVAAKLKNPHQEALKDIIRDVMINQSHSTSVSVNVQESAKKIQEDDNFFHLTPIEENAIIKKENIKYYPYFTPEQMESIGVFRESGNFYSDTAKIDNYTKDWYRRYKIQNDLSVSSDWYTKLKQEYDHYMEHPSDEAKQKILSLGWNPEIPVTIDNIKKVAYLREKEKTPEKVIKIQENYIFSKKDNVYNFDKWENGECNILFITGHSGSGKSTLAFQLAKEYGATVIQLDHIQCYEKFMKCHKQSDTTKLIKKYLRKNKDLKASDFDNILLKSFQKIYNEMFPWLLKELEKDKDTLYIIEGVHIMLFTKYKDIKEYPLICINTSMSKSMFRHWVRDQFTLKELIMYGPADIVLFKNWEDQYNDFKNDIENESYIINPKEDDNMIQESISSTVSKDYKPKGKKNLSSFKRIHITETIINKYKKEYPFLSHVRCKDTKEYICDGYIWFDCDELVAMVGSCEYRDDKTKWVVSLEITKNYRGYGLSKQILDYAVKNMNCKYLSVNKNNKIAKKVYDDYGFKVYRESDTMYFMTIDKSVKESYMIEEMKRSELSDDVFGIPQERKYPMPDEKHVRSAIKLFNYVEPKYEKQLAKKIIVNMKKYNIDASMVGDKNRLKQYLPKTMLESSNSNIPEFHTTQELMNYMKRNISYKNYTTLMSAEDVYREKKGSCHDQVMFELYCLKKMGKSPKALFLIEYSKSGNGTNAVTHSLVYYTEKNKVYWIENAWGGMEGIHTFNSIDELKNKLKELHDSKKFGNVSKYPELEITSLKQHKPGETLQQFVNICIG